MQPIRHDRYQQLILTVKVLKCPFIDTCILIYNINRSEDYFEKLAIKSFMHPGYPHLDETLIFYSHGYSHGFSVVFFSIHLKWPKFFYQKFYKILRRRQIAPVGPRNRTNQKGFPRNIQYRTRPKVPFSAFFRHCEIFLLSKWASFQFVWCFATEWMKNFNAVLVRHFGPTFGIFWYCTKKYVDTLTYFCYFWAFDMAPTWTDPG